MHLVRSGLTSDTNESLSTRSFGGTIIVRHEAQAVDRGWTPSDNDGAATLKRSHVIQSDKEKIANISQTM